MNNRICRLLNSAMHPNRWIGRTTKPAKGTLWVVWEPDADCTELLMGLDWINSNIMTNHGSLAIKTTNEKEWLFLKQLDSAIHAVIKHLERECIVERNSTFDKLSSAGF